MPSVGADGDVIDIALHTIKVQNWDKTISTIPTYRLVSDTFKNWRGMRESGGRRVKRSLFLDLSSGASGRTQESPYVLSTLYRRFEAQQRLLLV